MISLEISRSWQAEFCEEKWVVVSEVAKKSNWSCVIYEVRMWRCENSSHEAEIEIKKRNNWKRCKTWGRNVAEK